MASSMQSFLIRECKRRGFMVYSNNATGYGRNGIPDVFILGKDGQAIYVEIKEKGDRLSEIQKDTISDLEASKALVFVAYNMEDINTILGVLDEKY